MSTTKRDGGSRRSRDIPAAAARLRTESAVIDPSSRQLGMACSPGTGVRRPLRTRALRIARQAGVSLVAREQRPAGRGRVLLLGVSEQQENAVPASTPLAIDELARLENAAPVHDADELATEIWDSVARR